LNTTRSVAEYVAEKGIKISVLSRRTGISRNILDNCFSEDNTRELRADEFLSVCEFLGEDPVVFKREDTKLTGSISKLITKRKEETK